MFYPLIIVCRDFGNIHFSRAVIMGIEIIGNTHSWNTHFSTTPISSTVTSYSGFLLPQLNSFAETQVEFKAGLG